MRLWIIFSRILLGTERREMGLNDDGVSLVVEDGFGIGCVLDVFWRPEFLKRKSNKNTKNTAIITKNSARERY